jgi:hypothetical protein
MNISIPQNLGQYLLPRRLLASQEGLGFMLFTPGFHKLQQQQRLSFMSSVKQNGCSKKKKRWLQH